MSLLRVKVEFPAVWKGFQPYLGSLPGMDDVYTLYNFREEHIALLQDAEMVGHTLIIHLMQGLAMFLCCMSDAAVGPSCSSCQASLAPFSRISSFSWAQKSQYLRDGCAKYRRALSGRR